MNNIEMQKNGATPKIKMLIELPPVNAGNWLQPSFGNLSPRRLTSTYHATLIPEHIQVLNNRRLWATNRTLV